MFYRLYRTRLHSASEENSQHEDQDSCKVQEEYGYSSRYADDHKFVVRRFVNVSHHIKIWALF